MSNVSDMVDGMATVLKNNIDGIHTFNHPPDVINEFPAAVILIESIDPTIAFGGDDFEAVMRVLVFVNAGVSDEAFSQMYDHLDATQANKSVVAAIRADPTLDGKVDSSQITALENIGRRELPGGFYAGFDAVVEVVKTVT